MAQLFSKFNSTEFQVVWQKLPLRRGEVRKSTVRCPNLLVRLFFNIRTCHDALCGLPRQSNSASYLPRMRTLSKGLFQPRLTLFCCENSSSPLRCTILNGNSLAPDMSPGQTIIQMTYGSLAACLNALVTAARRRHSSTAPCASCDPLARAEEACFGHAFDTALLPSQTWLAHVLDLAYRTFRLGTP